MMTLSLRLVVLLGAAIVLVPQSSDAHSWYDELANDSRQQCCGDDDCAPYPYRATPGELGYELFIREKWWPVPQRAILGMFSPDGNAHACCFYGSASNNGCEAREPVVFRCVVLPGSSS